ncbi:MAG: hypothetical protein ACRBC3_09490 [Burkholderiaceae bacterium]
MKSIKVASAALVALFAAACSTPQPAPVAQPVVKAPEPVVVAPAPKPRPLFSVKAGTYNCELNRKVIVRQVSEGQDQAVLQWRKRRYQMKAVQTATGALRLENKASGLTWITIVGKSMLLDTKRGRQLANECRV